LLRKRKPDPTLLVHADKKKISNALQNSQNLVNSQITVDHEAIAQKHLTESLQAQKELLQAQFDKQLKEFQQGYETKIQSLQERLNIERETHAQILQQWQNKAKVRLKKFL
jgi:hypothetical protein